MADSIIKKYILTRVSGSASAALAAASKVAAAAAAAAALVSQTAAAASATAAAASQGAAATSASSAASSATLATSSKNAAATSEAAAAASATAAASSQTAAAASATNAATSETNAAASAAAATANGAAQVALAIAQVALATTQANNAANSFDSFDDRYLGAKSSNPSADNDGNSLITGALYWNTTVPEMRVWNGAAWVNMPFTATGALLTTNNLSELASSPTTARQNLGLGSAATLNAPASGNAAANEVVKGNDTRITGAATTGKAIAMAIVFGG